MGDLNAAATDFLSHQRLAVCGFARAGGNPANLIYRRVRRDGYDVAAVNPNAREVEGDRCYRSVRGIPGTVDGVVIATPPEAARRGSWRIVRRPVCRASGSTRSFGAARPSLCSEGSDHLC